MSETDRRRLELAGLASTLANLGEPAAAGELARRALDSTRSVEPDDIRWSALDELARTVGHFGAQRAAGKLATEAALSLLRADRLRGQGKGSLYEDMLPALRTLLGFKELDMATEVVEYAFGNYSYAISDCYQDPEVHLALAEALLASGERARAIEAVTVGWRASRWVDYDRTHFDD